MPKKLLFISHEASLSGAPIVLLHFLKWFKKNTAYEFDLLLLQDGPLRQEFEQLAPVLLYNDLQKESFPQKVKRKWKDRTPNSEFDIAIKRLASTAYALVYGNTIVTIPFLLALKKKLSCKTMCVVHELPFVVEVYQSKEYMRVALPKLDAIVAVSEAVKSSLLTVYQAPIEKIKVIHECIDLTALEAYSDQVSSVLVPKTEKEFIIGGCGTPEWRKGTDLLPDIASTLKKKYPDFPFRIKWLGAKQELPFVKQILYTANKRGVEEYLAFVPPTPHPFPVIASFDVFLLLSREDPFPLVALEAAYLHKPVLAFKGAGGIEDLVEEDAGTMVGFEDIDQLCEAIYLYYQNPDFATKTGKKASEKVKERYGVGIISSKLSALIDTFVS